VDPYISVFVTMLVIVAGLALLARLSQLPETVLLVLAGQGLRDCCCHNPIRLQDNKMD
jgi:hypothetical protein